MVSRRITTFKKYLQRDTMPKAHPTTMIRYLNHPAHLPYLQRPAPQAPILREIPSLQVLDPIGLQAQRQNMDRDNNGYDHYQTMEQSRELPEHPQDWKHGYGGIPPQDLSSQDISPANLPSQEEPYLEKKQYKFYGASEWHEILRS